MTARCAACIIALFALRPAIAGEEPKLMPAPGGGPSAGSIGLTAPLTEPLALTVPGAVLMALERNRELSVERVRPEISRTVALEREGVFVPRLVGNEIGWKEVEGQYLRGFGTVTNFRTDSPVGRLGVESFLWTGARVGFNAETTVDDRSAEQQLLRSRLGLTVAQPLLQGGRREVNLARVRAARVDADVSTFELRGFTERLVGLVEQACWDYALYRRETEILDESIVSAKQLLEETGERVRIGTLPRVELAAANSEISLRQQELIDARAAAEKARLQLIRLLNPPGEAPWDRELVLTADLSIPVEAPAEVGEHVAAALRQRPELKQAELLVERGDVDIVRTRNGLLPRMDLFVSLGRSSYADSFGDSWHSGDTFNDLFAGISFDIPLRRKAERAQHTRAVLQRGQAAEALANIRQLVELEVRTAWVEVERARLKAGAAAVTRALDEEKLQAEWEKHRIDRSSAFQVARAQRDLARSRIAEVESLAEGRKALAELARLDGSLLDRRSILVPASAPDSSNLR